ncbi:17737_t:CDS:2 [Rhizophagus irregularis]|nr:17737_t:CDS:2 [Rhizophagus irregularis]
MNIFLQLISFWECVVAATDIGEFVSHLSRHLSTLDTLIIRRSSAESSTSFRDFTVHRDKVRKALCWLKRNNRYYANIIIDDNVLCTLPDEGSIDYLLSQVRDAENRLHHVDYKLHDADRLDSETDDALAHMQSESGSVMWPNIDDTAINEFNMPGYIARAFPTLYPTENEFKDILGSSVDKLEDKCDDDEGQQEVDESRDDTYPDWMVLAEMGPNAIIDSSSDLGLHDVDRNNNWFGGVRHRYPNIDSIDLNTFMQQSRIEDD